MGSDPTLDRAAFEIEGWGPEGGQGTISLDPFFIGRYEVTVAQFGAFLADSEHAAAPEAQSGPADHPVTSVTWTDALAFTRWLEAHLRDAPSTPEELRTLLEDGWHMRLPTEAQWEKAARGTDGRIYPWGNEPSPDLANFDGSSARGVRSGDCAACAYGLAHMAGNVWEWTRSPYQPYPYDESNDRVVTADDALWVMRGGSFMDDAQNIRAANRGGADPGARRPFIGFRVVLSR